MSSYRRYTALSGGAQRPLRGLPRFVGTRHGIADAQLAKVRADLAEGRGEPAVLQERIDQWLEFRSRPDEELWL